MGKYENIKMFNVLYIKMPTLCNLKNKTYDWSDHWNVLNATEIIVIDMINQKLFFFI